MRVGFALFGLGALERAGKVGRRLPEARPVAHVLVSLLERVELKERVEGVGIAARRLERRERLELIMVVRVLAGQEDTEDARVHPPRRRPAATFSP